MHDILAFEGASNYVKIHTTRHCHVTYGKIKVFEDYLHHDRNFIRVSKSYIISVQAVTVIKNNKVILTNDVEVPIGSTYKDTVNTFFRALTFGAN